MSVYGHGDLAQQADLVNKAFNAELAFNQMAPTSSQPDQQSNNFEHLVGYAFHHRLVRT